MNEIQSTDLENEIESACDSSDDQAVSEEVNEPLKSIIDREETDTEPDTEDIPEAINEDPEPEEEEPSVIEALQNEIKALKEALEESHLIYNKLSSELIEFSELYPEVSLASIPDSIWESARAGIPLSAAYALAEKKAAVNEFGKSRALAANDETK